MQPASRQLEIYRGDSVTLVFRLSALIAGETVPLDVTGSEFELRLSNKLLMSTATDTLELTATDELTELRWEAEPAETKRIASGLITQYELSRIDPVRGRRTYLNGVLKGIDAPKPANGDTALSLTVNDAAIEVAVTVDDRATTQIISALLGRVAALEDGSATKTLSNVSALTAEQASAFFLAAAKALPPLPADESAIPAEGGAFLNGGSIVIIQPE